MNEWRDLSDYVVHFSKPPKRQELANNGGFWSRLNAMRQNDRTGYWPMLSILGEGRLRAMTAFGAARKRAGVSGQESVCFSEVPLEFVKRVAERRSEYGIGFTKQWIKSSGGAPVWYLEKGSDHADALEELMHQAQNAPDHPLWRLTPFIDQPGEYVMPSGRVVAYRFEWEREWRVVHDVSFTPDDVSFLFIPESLHAAARRFFDEAFESHSGPAYFCPFLDTSWSRRRIEAALSKAGGTP